MTRKGALLALLFVLLGTIAGAFVLRPFIDQ